MREAKEREILSGPSPQYPLDVPDLRRKIIIEDYDSGTVVRHEIELHRTSRIDCYRVVIDGKEWKNFVGWSAILSGIRKALPRMRSQYS